MAHEHGILDSCDQRRYPAGPRSVVRLGWLRHARCPDDIVSAQGIPEEGLPVDFACPTPGFTGAVNDKDGSAHEWKGARFGQSEQRIREARPGSFKRLLGSTTSL